MLTANNQFLSGFLSNMIFISFGQLKAVYVTLIFGVAIFLLIFAVKILTQYNRQNLVMKNIFWGIFLLFYGAGFVILTNLFNFGRYNISLIIFYITEVVALDKTSCKLLDFFSAKVYSIYRILHKWGKYYFARKIKSLED